MDIVAYRGAICNQKVWFIGSLKSCMQKNQVPESHDEKVISLGGGGEGGDSLLKGVKKKSVLFVSCSNNAYFLVNIIFNIFIEYILYVYVHFT